MLTQEAKSQTPEPKTGIKQIKDTIPKKNTSQNIENLMSDNGNLEPGEPPDPKKRKNNKHTPLKIGLSQIPKVSTLLALALLITVASSAQIGTSHSEISIMQIDSMKISRKTWITEETQAGPQKILKIAKGTAIISERYIQEAQIIASELGDPVNIEKNTISQEQERTLLIEMNSIDRSEITLTETSGYKEEEKQSIEEIIAQISLVFWIKNKNEL